MTELPAEPYYKVRRRRFIARRHGAVREPGCAGGGIRDWPSAKQSGRCGLPGRRLMPRKRIAPLVHGEVAALAVAQTPFRVPDLAFKDADGHDKRSPTGAAAPCCSISGPPGACRAAAKCRRSMRCRPSSAARASRSSPSISTPAIRQKPLAFLKDVGITHLAYYTDQSAQVFEDLKSAGKAFGMPTTLIVDRSGCEIGTMAGPAEWSSDDGVKLVSAAAIVRAVIHSRYRRLAAIDDGCDLPEAFPCDPRHRCAR